MNAGTDISGVIQQLYQHGLRQRDMISKQEVINSKRDKDAYQHFSPPRIV